MPVIAAKSKNRVKNSAKPFLKWAGGKTQLIDTINSYLPIEVKNGRRFTYIEPFVGSGAILFWALNQFPNIKQAVINDANGDLINTYKAIASNVNELVDILYDIQSDYHSIDGDEDNKKAYYYEKRELYNTRQSGSIEQAALFIYLNRACFNGLYRVNRSNHFNVPIGSYKKPTICDKDNLIAVSEALQRVEMLSGDFGQTIQHAGNNSLFYFDPPYKPLSETSSFNSYAKDDFNDSEQLRLRDFCNKLNLDGHKWILSNSDVRGKDAADNFFDDIYSEYNIFRVRAKRMINANPAKRGELTELLITNYQHEQIMQTAESR